MRKVAVTAVAMLAAGVSSALGAGALTGTFTEMEPPVPDAAVRGIAINDAGQVMGTAYFADWSVAGFVRDADGTYRELPPFPGGLHSSADPLALNGAGDVVGYGSDPFSIHPHAAILWPATGGIVDLGRPPGDVEAIAVDINDAGWIAGYSLESSSPPYESSAWVRDPETGAFVDLGTLPGGEGVVGVGINNAGVATGFVNMPGTGPVGFTWTEAGGMVAMPLPPDGMSPRPQDINNIGQVLGNHWVWDPVDGYLELTPVDGYDFATPESINDNGLAVGYSSAYLPESDTYRSDAVSWDLSTGEATVVTGVPDGGMFKAVNNSGVAVVYLGFEWSSETFVGQIREDPVTPPTRPPTPPATAAPAASPVPTEPTFTG